MSRTIHKTSAPAPVISLDAPAITTATWVEIVQQKVQAIEYGFVQIVVHDSKVVQVESTERHRFDLRRHKDVDAHSQHGKTGAAE